MAPKAVLWDADGVLQQGFPSWPGVFAELVGDQADAFAAAVWEDLEQALAGEFDMGAHVDAVIEDLGLTDRRHAIRDLWGTFDPLPASRNLVASVRAAGTPCYLATNQDTLRASYMRQRLGYDDLLDGSFYSCEVGAAKPDARYFLHIADEIGVAPRELVFVDDLAGNVEAATELGLRGVLWHHEQDIALLKLRLAALEVPF